MKPLGEKEVNGISIGTRSLTHVHTNFLTNTRMKHTPLHHAEHKQKAVLTYAVLIVVCTTQRSYLWFYYGFKNTQGTDSDCDHLLHTHLCRTCNILTEPSL